MDWKKTLLCFILAALFSFTQLYKPPSNKQEDNFVSYIVDPKQMEVKLFWKDDSGNLIRNFSNLQKFVASKNKKLLFAMNGGIYQEDNTPLGLFIENHKIITPLNKNSGAGNFYMQPNGVFYITTNNKAYISSTSNYDSTAHPKYATQSGPMLVINSVINSAFTRNSPNTNIRNAVGILPDGKIVFAMSKAPINFYDFAFYFQKAGCINALYLDGFVSRTYLPAKNWSQLEGNFGVIIAVVE